jgi:hypothetical protein
MCEGSEPFCFCVSLCYKKQKVKLCVSVFVSVLYAFSEFVTEYEALSNSAN